MDNILICWERKVTERQHWELMFVCLWWSLGKSNTSSPNSPLLFQVLSETVTDADGKVDLQMGTVVCPSDEKKKSTEVLKTNGFYYTNLISPSSQKT